MGPFEALFVIAGAVIFSLFASAGFLYLRPVDSKAIRDLRTEFEKKRAQDQEDFQAKSDALQDLIANQATRIRQLEHQVNGLKEENASLHTVHEQWKECKQQLEIVLAQYARS